MTTDLLFKKIADNDEQAFNTLFKSWYVRLLTFAKHYFSVTEVSEEVVSDVFVWLWQNKSLLVDVRNPESYLYIAVKNRCLNELRKMKYKHQFIEEAVAINLSTVNNTPHKDMEREELFRKLNDLVNALPRQRRLIFKMIKEDGLTAKQTAEILQLSPRTVETHLYKAIKKLEEEITDYLGYSPKKKQMKCIILLMF